jgi:hypothetical protein
VSWPTPQTAPFDLEAHLVSALPALVGGVAVKTDMQGYTSGKRVVFDHVGSYPIDGGRRSHRINFQAVADDADDAWDLAVAVITAMDPLVGTGRVVKAKVANGPTPLPSGYAADSGDPARYFIAVDIRTVDL